MRSSNSSEELKLDSVKDRVKDSGEICLGYSRSINWQLIGYKGFLIGLQLTQLLCILYSRDAGRHSCTISDRFQQWLLQHLTTLYVFSAVFWGSENGNLESSLAIIAILSPCVSVALPPRNKTISSIFFFFCRVLPPLKLARVSSPGSTTTLNSSVLIW